MPRLAASVLGLLLFRSRRDAAARGLGARAARGEDRPTWHAGQEVSVHENRTETRHLKRSAANQNTAEEDQPTKPKPN
jgi:hypothetical protein